MQRSNMVFLMGKIVQYAEREGQGKGKPIKFLDMLLLTDRPDISGWHRVVVQGQQVEEVKHFLTVTQPELPDVVVLGWLRSGEQECIVMADRITMLVTSSVRRVAVEALRRTQEAKNL